MRLAYKDMGLEEKRRDDKMKNFDPRKKEQAERLGMAFGSVRYELLFCIVSYVVNLQIHYSMDVGVHKLAAVL